MADTNISAEPGKQEIIITRTFDAPRQLVFQAYTNPDHIARWWGPAYLTTLVEKMDVQPGGLWRYVQTDPEGNEFAFHGVYHAITSPESLVLTFEFEGMPGHVLLETIRFEELDGRTLMTDSSVFQSVEDRDGMLQAGMEEGASESMDRFAELLAKL